MSRIAIPPNRADRVLNEQGVMDGRFASFLEILAENVNETPDITGTVNNARNVGNEIGIFLQLTGTILDFKSLKAGSNFEIIDEGETLTLNATASNPVTNAANVGSGFGSFKGLNGTILEFKSFIGGSGITIAAGTDDLTISSNIPDGTVTNSITTWSGTAWTELSEVTLAWVAGVMTLSVEDDSATLQTGITIDADGTLSLYHDGTKRFDTSSTGLQVIADATGQVTHALRNNADTANQARFFSDAPNSKFRIQNFLDSDTTIFEGTNSSSATVTMLELNPNGTTDLYDAGAVHGQVTADGFRNVGGTGFDHSFMSFFDDTNTTRYGFVQFANATPVARFESEMDNAPVELKSRNSASSPTLLFVGDPNGASELYHAGTLELTTKSGGVVIDDELEIDGDLNHGGSGIGFYGTAPVTKPTVTGSRAGNAALASLLTALAGQGLLTDSST